MIGVIVEDGGKRRMSDFDPKNDYMISENPEARMMAMLLGIVLSKTGPMFVSIEDVMLYKSAELIPDVQQQEDTHGFVFRLVERPDAS